MFRKTLEIKTGKRALYNISPKIESVVLQSKIKEGICHIFVQHTSASLIINENADPHVQLDLESFFSRLVKDGDPIFKHKDEGDDDMAAHIRSTLTATQVSIPIENNRLMLGIWQGLYLWEHRFYVPQRRVIVSIFD